MGVSIHHYSQSPKTLLSVLVWNNSPFSPAGLKFQIRLLQYKKKQSETVVQIAVNSSRMLEKGRRRSASELVYNLIEI